jgi:TolB-like protein
MKTFLALLFIMTLMASSVISSCAEKPTRKIIAVTAFTNINKDPNQDWLSVGIGETLTVKLSQVPSLSLVERMRLNDAMKELKLQESGLVEPSSATKLGKLLGAQTVVMGSFQKSGEQIRLTARFVAPETGEISNAAQADGKMDDIFAVQDKLADKLLDTLGVTITEEVREKVAVKPTKDIGAYEAYSKGVTAMDKGDMEAASKELKVAAEKDPSFKQASDLLQFVDWARPNSHSATYQARLRTPYDQTYDAMIRAIKRAKNTSLHTQDKSTGKIEAKWKGGILSLSAGQDLNIELKSMDSGTGLTILSQTKRSYFGIRQVVDYGESRKSIDRVLKPFYEELQK